MWVSATCQSNRLHLLQAAKQGCANHQAEVDSSGVVLKQPKNLRPWHGRVM
jgi:hypothetical protein